MSKDFLIILNSPVRHFYTNLLKRLKVEVWFEACVVVGTGVWTVVGFGTGVVMNVSFAFADSLSCNGAQ